MKNYKLVISKNNTPIKVIKSGTLEEIDDYIYKNSISNSLELFGLLNEDGKYDEPFDNYKFEIYSLGHPIKKVDILFKDDIKIIKKEFGGIRNLEETMFRKFISDENFHQSFCIKYVYPFTKEPDKTTSSGETIVNILSSFAFVAFFIFFLTMQTSKSHLTSILYIITLNW